MGCSCRCFLSFAYTVFGSVRIFSFREVFVCLTTIPIFRTSNVNTFPVIPMLIQIISIACSVIVLYTRWADNAAVPLTISPMDIRIAVGVCIRINGKIMMPLYDVIRKS